MRKIKLREEKFSKTTLAKMRVSSLLRFVILLSLDFHDFLFLVLFFLLKFQMLIDISS